MTSLVIACVLGCLIILWLILELTVLDKYTRWTISPGFSEWIAANEVTKCVRFCGAKVGTFRVFHSAHISTYAVSYILMCKCYHQITVVIVTNYSYAVPTASKCLVFLL